MDILKAEMDRKRKQLAKTDVCAPGQKFFKRGDLAKQQEEEYWKKHRGSQVNKTSSVQVEEATGDEAVNLLEDGKEGEKKLSRETVVKRLRERGEPIILFAETETESRKRLRRLEIEQPELKEGWKNDFQAALRGVDQEFVDEVIKGTKSESGKHDVKVDDLKTFDEIKEMTSKIGKGDVAADCDGIFGFFNYLQMRWGQDLNAREESLKRSAKGKFEAGIYKQTDEHIKPLISQLKNHTIASDIRVHLVSIVNFVLERDYVQANNAYMQLAIGNAPWPVGVTRSGLHQRPGSAKSYVANIAHVLNDETQRKYIQGIKRLMTKCQLYYPSDPSRSVDFVRLDPPTNTAE